MHGLLKGDLMHLNYLTLDQVYALLTVKGNGVHCTPDFDNTTA